VESALKSEPALFTFCSHLPPLIKTLVELCLVDSMQRRCSMKLFASIDNSRISPEKAQELMKMFQCCLAPEHESASCD
jgi:hypothetical protein